MTYPKVAAFKTPQAFRVHLSTLGLNLDLDDDVLSAPQSPLAQPLRTQSTEHRTQSTEHRTQSTEHRAQSTEHRTQSTEHRAQSTEHRAQSTEHRTQSTEHRTQSTEHRTQNTAVGARTIGNRFAILPMEGWDGTPDGKPTALTIRRWQHFGQSGAKLIWGGEAVAVRHDGRANPNQLLINDDNLASLDDLRQQLARAHERDFGTTSDLLIGLQLTHSGRYARPNVKSKPEPMILYHHPILDRRVGLGPGDAVMTDAQIDDLIGDFVHAAVRAGRIGFDFVDVKHCHGYLGHEFLSAVDRPGRYGGSLDNRTRFLREIVAGIRRDAPGLDIGVRLSAFDIIPFKKGAHDIGEPETGPGVYRHAFGCHPHDPTQLDLSDAVAFLNLLRGLHIELVCLTAGSPYYNPHIQRPAAFPPSDGYLPPEDPLIGVARQINAVAALKQHFPDLILVGSGYTYLQDYLPHVAQAQVRLGHVDAVGLGRMVLAYPTLPADVLAGRPLQTKRVCRTFSDCTTAPRNGLVSGCYPLDPYYKNLPDHDRLKAAKK